MTTAKRLAGLLLVVVLAALQRSAQADRVQEAEGRLTEVNHMLSDLTKKFIEQMRIVFYDGQQAAQENENWPLLVISGLVARVEASLYAIQSRALFIAQDIIATFFVAKTMPLDQALVESQYLIDMIINCLINHSIDNGLKAVEWDRKKIYLLLRTYEDNPGVKDLAVQYFGSIAALRGKRAESEQAFEQAMNNYKYDSPMILFAEHETATLEAVDRIIKEAVMFSNSLEGVEDGAEGMSQEQLLAKYVNPEIMADLNKSEALAAGKLPIHFEDHEIDAQDLDGAQVYEDRALQEAGNLNSYLIEIDHRQQDLDNNFDQAAKELFYAPQRVADQDNQTNYPLLAVSAQIAEIEGLLYADERRMLTIIRDIIQQNTNIFTYVLAISRRPIDIMIKRLMKHAIEYGLKSVEWRRKKVFLISQRYEGDTMDALLTNFYRRLNYRKEQVEREAAQVQEMNLLLKHEITATTIDVMMKTVREHMDAAVQKWRDESDDPRLLRAFLEPTLLSAIKATKNRTYNRVHRAEGRMLAGITIKALDDYEKGLTGREDAPSSSGVRREPHEAQQ